MFSGEVTLVQGLAPSTVTPAALPATESSVLASGDEPLMPREDPGLISAVAGVQQTGEADGAAPTPTGVQRDPATGRFVSSPATLTPETTPAPETPVVATLEAAKPPAPARVEDTPEFKALQAAKDREVAQARRELEQARAERAQADRQRTIESAAQQGEAETRASLIAEGYTEEQADKVAKRSTALFKEDVRIQRQNAQLQSWAKMQVATQIAQEHGLTDPSVLFGLQTEQAMLATAKDYGQKLKDSQELVTLRAEVARLKQGKVPNGTDPSQQFSNGTTSFGKTDNQILTDFDYSIPEQRVAIDAALRRQGLHPRQ